MGDRRIVMALTVVAGLLFGPSVAMADSDKYKHDESYWGFWNWFGKSKTGVASVEKEQYPKACGTCHFAYQPGLLPVLSWEQLMNQLDDHFGEKLEIPQGDVNLIRSHLLDNAAGRVNFELSNQIMSAQATTDNPAPLRITETAFFIQKHKGIPPQEVSGNQAIASFSYCDSCHTKASSGSYAPSEVQIPGSDN